MNYARSRKKQLAESLRLPFVALSLLAGLSGWASGYHVPAASATLYYSLLLLKLMGLLVSSLLVWYSLDADNSFLRHMHQINAQPNYGAVLNTSAVKLFGWLSWAEIGLFYFGGGLLSLLVFRQNPTASYPILFGLTIAALPYTFWSVYYQWRRARQWCVLCLAVKGLLWLEFAALLYFQQSFPWTLDLSISEIHWFVTCFLLLPALWVLLKPTWSKSLRADGLQQSLQKIKFDQGYLESLSQRAQALPPIFTGMQVPILGNPESPDTFTIVASPTCSLCARTHLELKTLMTELKNVKCQIIIIGGNRPDDLGAVVAHRILSQPIDNMLVALHEWYTTRQLENWLRKAKLSEATSEGTTQLDLHRHWCELAGINATPTVFFNEVEIPRYYAVPEFKKLISSIQKETA